MDWPTAVFAPPAPPTTTIRSKYCYFRSYIKTDNDNFSRTSLRRRMRKLQFINEIRVSFYILDLNNFYDQGMLHRHHSEDITGIFWDVHFICQWKRLKTAKQEFQKIFLRDLYEIASMIDWTGLSLYQTERTAPQFRQIDVKDRVKVCSAMTLMFCFPILTCIDKGFAWILGMFSFT